MKGRISEDRVKGAIKEREKRDKITIYKFLIMGYSYVEIISTVQYGDKHYISKLVEELKKEGKITDEQIEEYRFEKNEKQKKEIILQGLNQGLAYKEIVDNYNEKYTDKHISERVVEEYKNKLVERGEITEYIIQERRKERRKERREERKEQNIVTPQEKRVLKLLKLGFTAKQIKRITQLTTNNLWKIKKSLKEKGKITEEEIQYSTCNKEKYALERRKHIVRMINFSESIDENVVQEHIDYVRATIQLDELNPKDIKLLKKVIPMHPKIVSFDNVNFILRTLTEQNNDIQAIRFIDECLIACEDKDKCTKLEYAKTEIENKINDLKRRNRNVTNKVITMLQSSNNRRKNRN